MSVTSTNLPVAGGEALLDRCLDRVRAAGATGRAVLQASDHWEVTIAAGEIEAVEQARAQGLSLRIYFDDGRTAGVSTTDLDPTTLDRLIDDGLALAAAGAPDPWNGLPDPTLCGLAPVAGLCDAGTTSREASLARILAADRIARADSRVLTTHRCGCSHARGHWHLRSSDGVDLVNEVSNYGARLVVVAQDGEERQTGFAYTAHRAADELRSAEALAEEALERACAGFGWRQVPSGPVPVVFDQRCASELLGLIGSLCSGGAVYRGSTCWGDALGAPVASPAVTVIDDPLIPGALGSRPCDGEGLQARPLRVIAAGRLETWLTDCYSARRLGHACTGHAGGTSNLRLEPGEHSQEDLLRACGTGLLVTALHGHGVDPSSGQWSKGAQGFWISDGGRTHPVQEVTLAGRIQDLFRGIRAIGDDPCPERATSSPSLLVDGLTLGGS